MKRKKCCYGNRNNLIPYSDRNFYCVNQNIHHYWDQYFIYKYNNILSTFTDHITIFRTVSIDILQLNLKNDKQITPKMADFFFCKLLRIIKLLFLMLLREATLETKVPPTNRNISAFPLYTSYPLPNVFHFCTIFLGTDFSHQNKNNVIETTSCPLNIEYIMCLNT